MNNSRNLILQLRILRENRKKYTKRDYKLRLLDLRERMIDDVQRRDVPLTDDEEARYRRLLTGL